VTEGDKNSLDLKWNGRGLRQKLDVDATGSETRRARAKRPGLSCFCLPTYGFGLVAGRSFTASGKANT